MSCCGISSFRFGQSRAIQCEIPAGLPARGTGTGISPIQQNRPPVRVTAQVAHPGESPPCWKYFAVSGKRRGGLIVRSVAPDWSCEPDLELLRFVAYWVALVPQPDTSTDGGQEGRIVVWGDVPDGAWSDYLGAGERFWPAPMD